MELSYQLARNDGREKDLLRRVARGDRKAFEALYCSYFPRLSRFLGRLTHRHDLIEEAINDTFWVVWQRAVDFRGQSQVSTWIMGIAYRCGLKTLRREGPATRELDESELPLLEPEFQQDLADWLSEGLRQLPADQRLTLELAYYFGHSCEEIGEIMECPASTVKARMFRARLKLRNTLPGLGGMETEKNHESR
jgi:RNA polymerase sigma-70 factor (ECF subfamily)